MWQKSEFYLNEGYVLLCGVILLYILKNGGDIMEGC